MAHRFCHLARFVLEAVTPLSISTGSPDGVFDTALVLDANDLPAIPASSLAGVLRHLHPAGPDADAANALFGFQTRSADYAEQGQASRVQVSWCAILNQQGRAVPPLALGVERAMLEADPLLAPLLDQARTLMRDRVRIGPRGAAADQGKFDRAAVPAGYRFAGELLLWGDRPDDPDWTLLLALLRDRRLRLGGATRAGLGRVKLVRLHGRVFDLHDDASARAFRGLGSGLDDYRELAQQPYTPEDPPPGWHQFQLHLKAKDFWRVGQGTVPVGVYKKDPDALPVLEEQLNWDGFGHGSRGLRLALLPGSALKGALAHRVAYYDNCLRGTFVESVADPGAWDKSAEDGGSPAVRELFGYSKTRELQRGEPTGQAGRLFIDDAWVSVRPEAARALMHNAIDRFTGGVRNRLLFAEEVLWQSELVVDCLLDLREHPTDDASRPRAVSPDARLALRLALDDLLAGRLPLGAGGGKGHGRFSGRAEPALDVIHPLEEAA